MKCAEHLTSATMEESDLVGEIMDFRKRLRWLWAALIVISVVLWTRMFVLEARAEAIEAIQRNSIDILRDDVRAYLKGRDK